MTRFISAIAALFALAACETVEGAGEDIQAAGSAISEEAQDVQTGQ